MATRAVDSRRKALEKELRQDFSHEVYEVINTITPCRACSNQTTVDSLSDIRRYFRILANTPQMLQRRQKIIWDSIKENDGEYPPGFALGDTFADFIRNQYRIAVTLHRLVRQALRRPPTEAILRLSEDIDVAISGRYSISSSSNSPPADFERTVSFALALIAGLRNSLDHIKDEQQPSIYLSGRYPNSGVLEIRNSGSRQKARRRGGGTEDVLRAYARFYRPELASMVRIQPEEDGWVTVLPVPEGFFDELIPVGGRSS
jgi:hypothetical protein